MAFAYSPKIVTDGLVFAVDAANTKSYPGSGTTWKDLSGNGNDGTLTNGPTFDSGNGGSIVFDRSDDVVETPVIYDTWHQHDWTINAWFKYNNANIDNGFFEMTKNGVDSWGLSTVPRAGKLFIFWVSSTSSGHNLVSQQIATNNIINVTITFSSPGGTPTSNDLYNNTKTFINGEEITHSAGGGANVSSSGKLLVGSDAYKFGGNMYAFHYYEKTLSSKGVLQNYNALKSRFGL